MQSITRYIFSLVVCFISLAREARGHGRLMNPPSRSSLWRFGFHSPINYNDNELFCGGFAMQWYTNNGRCGICGDNWHGPRDNEAGGKYAQGIISRQYRQGQIISVQVDVTAYHAGWFEFRLCPNNDATSPATHECLDRNVLEMSDGSGSRWYFPRGSGTGTYNFRLRLPSDVTCTQCVLQWKYHAGNNWGSDPDGRGCVGCGAQEEFYGCADVSISADSSMIISRTLITTTRRKIAPFRQIITTPSNMHAWRPRTAVPRLSTVKSVTPTCRAVGTWANVPSLDKWCVRNCAMNHCPRLYCRCE